MRASTLLVWGREECNSLPMRYLLLCMLLFGSSCVRRRTCTVNYLNIDDITSDKSMNSPLHMATAREAADYALMAFCSYDNRHERGKQKERKFFYHLPKNLRIKKRFSYKSGLQAVLFERRGGDKGVQERIVAFRGTDQAADWLHGNLGETQYREALALARKLKAAHPKTKFSVTGHSLGGGLALYVSYYLKKTDTYLFMPSFRLPKHAKQPRVRKNKRIVINEKGDLLGIHRTHTRRPFGITRTVVYNFTRCDTPLANHSMKNLLHGLLLIKEQEDLEYHGILSDYYATIEEHPNCERVLKEDTKTYYCWKEDHVGLLKYSKTYRNHYKKRDYFQRHKRNFMVAGLKDSVKGLGDRNSQVLFQISVKIPAIWVANLYLYGTVRAFWNAYDDASPFREHNYTPGLFWQYKNFRIGFEHESNGLGGEEKRRWNRIYLEGWMEWQKVKLQGKLWYVPPWHLENNRDIGEYMGNGELSLLVAPFNKKWLNLEVRIRKGTTTKVFRGALELGMVLRLGNSSWVLAEHEGLYIQYFYGYGQSLLDYKKKIKALRVGFMFSFD